MLSVILMVKLFFTINYFDQLYHQMLSVILMIIMLLLLLSDTQVPKM